MPSIWITPKTCSFLKGSSVHWMESQRVPYAVKGSQWVGFKNRCSYNAKVDYLRSRGLGGAAVWNLDMDDFSGQFCDQGKYPLISHLQRELSEDWKTQETAVPEPPPTASTSPFESTQEHFTTAKPDNSCFHNITVVYPVSSFCTHRANGLYVRPDRPNTVYRCVQRTTYVTRCHSLGTEQSSGVQVLPSNTVLMVSSVTAALLLLSAWWSHS
ncbi:acidic mammalian chitinase-like [Trachinotus anak]|uniref:acidic mammalian chitinase-like n=1 Tax=Trachinotus anak TaxID=443729 RepID=UPI0039F19C02